jgi:circadian clock protein KaiB
VRRKKSPGAESPASVPGDFIDLQHYVTDAKPRCLAAYEIIRKICEEYAPDRYRITVIDLLRNPVIARQDDITAIPTLVRLPRSPGRGTIVRMLTDTKKVLDLLDIRTRTPYCDEGAILGTPAH